jgi:excisionase family DNA binding protein
MASDSDGPAAQNETDESRPGGSDIIVRRDLDGKLLTRAETARALGVHPKTLDRWVETGRIQSLSVGERRRFRLEDLEEGARLALEARSAEVVRMFTRESLADYLAVHPATVDRLRKRGMLPFVRLHNAVRFDPRDVDHFITRNTHKGG